MAAVLKTLAFAGAALALIAVGGTARAADPLILNAGDVQFQELPPQRLARGQCGLFLWARTASPMLLMTVTDDPAHARVRAGGSQRDLPRTRFQGTPVHGQFEQQTFSDGRITLEVEVHFDEERPLRDGAIVREGVVRVVNGAGWKTILPVGGLVACQA